MYVYIYIYIYISVSVCARARRIIKNIKKKILEDAFIYTLSNATFNISDFYQNILQSPVCVLFIGIMSAQLSLFILRQIYSFIRTVVLKFNT